MLPAINCADLPLDAGLKPQKEPVFMVFLRNIHYLASVLSQKFATEFKGERWPRRRLAGLAKMRRWSLLGRRRTYFDPSYMRFYFVLTWVYPYGPESPCGISGNPIYSALLPPILAAPIDPPPGPWKNYEPNL